jgi:hypothetical protein
LLLHVDHRRRQNNYDNTSHRKTPQHNVTKQLTPPLSTQFYALACDPPPSATASPHALRHALLPRAAAAPFDVGSIDATLSHERDHLIVVCAPVLFENVLACAAQCRLTRRRGGVAAAGVVVFDQLVASGALVEVYGVDTSSDTLELQVCYCCCCCCCCVYTVVV